MDRWTAIAGQAVSEKAVAEQAIAGQAAADQAVVGQAAETTHQVNFPPATLLIAITDLRRFWIPQSRSLGRKTT